MEKQFIPDTDKDDPDESETAIEKLNENDKPKICSFTVITLLVVGVMTGFSVGLKLERFTNSVISTDTAQSVATKDVALIWETLDINEQTRVTYDGLSVSDVDGMSRYRISHPKQPFEKTEQKKLSEDKWRDSTDRQTKYGNNERHTWCFHWHFVASKRDWNFPLVIDIEFTFMDLEKGFDRILLRHFNDTFEDTLQSYTGSALLNTLHYWIEPQTKKSICIEFVSDESVVGTGFIAFVTTRLDMCMYKHHYEDDTNIDDSILPYSENPFFVNTSENQRQWNKPVHSDRHCFTRNEVGSSWERGPFFDGKCGVGVYQYDRSEVFLRNVSSVSGVIESGIVNCSLETNVSTGPDENINNHENKQLPTSIRYGWAAINKTFNGVLRIDPYYPNVFAVYKSSQLSFALDHIESSLKNTLQTLIAEQADEKVLSYSVLKHAYFDQSTEFLAARLLHSLLIGRKFVMAFTGSSNTAGHDNMFLSTYAIQLQSRLAHLWTQIGVKGAAFSVFKICLFALYVFKFIISFKVRNIGIGGPTRTTIQAWINHVISSETVTYPLNDRGDSIDILTWESFMNDAGKPPIEFLEMHLRHAAALNVILSIKSKCCLYILFIDSMFYLLFMYEI
ncbi:hypothetical protein RFI_07938 [Reticulomyxa filosa]|uniref:Uncharacterized protein n=1 Tax=Reticulomyxa filosa TaxID=46433 RepID=X6NSC0_RETFI|nr:hypothetical protein RFI_07938 [Reticulomyxa filosa]|eukprot:ETO29190.1 hypothetical protein RFI_07938 [Reticulomyxa filosa]